ncbi:MAG: type transport system permease protein [Acidobacteriota bacterium]|jgi:ABC-type transport system involved in multi-copper enzyme maturation permease subunit|nr:type transport system permease protein [Acidobacteriota bacterium]
MKLWEIFRFEIIHQSQRISTWLYFAIVLGFTYMMGTEEYVNNARSGGYFLNSPFVIASVATIGSMIGLLITASLAGDAGARDVQTRMHPLLYTTPVGKANYLRGRFLAAFILNLLILVAVPIGLVLAALVPRAEADLIGPFRPGAYLGAYVFLVLPNAFVVTALLFSLSALGRKAIASYLGSALLFFHSNFSWQFVAGTLGWWKLARLLDPFGVSVFSELSKAWTPVEKNTFLVGLQGPLLANRALWLGIALSALALTHRRFRFAHPSPGSWWNRGTRRQANGAAPISVPQVQRQVKRRFGFATHALQTFAIAWQSFRTVVTSWGWFVLAFLPFMVVLSGPELMQHMGIRLFPTTARMTAWLTNPQDGFWLLIPLLIVFFAGELVWREREARLSEIADAAPAPDWVPFVGKLIGLSAVLVLLQALILAAGMLVQVRMGYHLFETGLYARILFGFQLPDYLLFVLLAFTVHAIVNHKYVGNAVLLLVYGFSAFAAELGLEHKLLVYASDPGWVYSDMRGFAPFVAPFVWFKLYWAAWALLLAVAAKLFWVRGKEPGLGSRIQLAGRRSTRAAVGSAVAAVGLILTLGGFIFYNTNVLNAYHTASDKMERRAEYERRYGQYKGFAQPRKAGASLHVEIHPQRREVDIRGTFHLVNRSAVAIGSIHVATASVVETRAIRFDRPAKCVLADDDLGHRIYALGRPLQPGDSLRLGFEVHSAPRGFSNSGVDASVVPNGTYFAQHEWLPAIGYQPNRELQNAGERRAHRLAARPEYPSLYDVRARNDSSGGERIAFEAVVGTDEGQVAVAPGRLRRTWKENRRRYFHYVTDAPICEDYAFYSAAYAVHEARWNGVSIQIYHHPDHAWNLDRMVRSVQASLSYHVKQFGPYPQGQIRLVEYPGDALTLHASPINISYQEAFSLFNPVDGPRALDFPFAVVAHEVAHQWWGNQVTPAPVEGAPVLSESLAWYSAMGVVEKTYGRDHLRLLLRLMREAYLTPHARANVPLLRATDWLQVYRKGPFAMYALREYIGEERVNIALRRLFQKYGSGEPPLPTSLDLYRELQAVTPASLRYLLVDLFEANTFWELAAERVTARQTESGSWQVTLEVEARKEVVDSLGAVTEVPMNDLVEIGVFAAAEDGGLGEPLYLRMHRIRSGEQSITVTVPGKPAGAGIDPRSLLIDVDATDNLANIR